MLARATSLKDSAVTSLWDNEYHDTTIFFQALAKHTKLYRVAFMGDWDMFEAELVKFVALHAHSLRCLVLDGCTVIRSWSEAIQEIARTTSGKLAFFRARQAAKWRDEIEGEEDDRGKSEVTASDLARLGCPFDWSSVEPFLFE
jgi:hypothetical protein